MIYSTDKYSTPLYVENASHSTLYNKPVTDITTYSGKYIITDCLVTLNTGLIKLKDK